MAVFHFAIGRALPRLLYSGRGNYSSDRTPKYYISLLAPNRLETYMIWTPPRGSRPPGFRPPGCRPPAARSDLVFLSESHILHLATPTRPSAAPPGCPPPPRPSADRSAGVHVASVRPGDSRGLMMTIFDTTSTTCTHPAAPNTFDSNRLVTLAQ